MLKQMHLCEVLGVDQTTFDQTFDVITLDRVISEVKDEKSREYIRTRLPYQIDVKNADTFLEQRELDIVHNFAKDTGDYRSLSKVDMMVIALGVKYSKLKGEFQKIKLEPKDLKEFRPDRLKEAYDALSESEPDSDDHSDNNDDEEKKQPQLQLNNQQGSDDEWADTPKTRQQKRTDDRNQQKKEWYEKKMQAKREREEAARLKAQQEAAG